LLDEPRVRAERREVDISRALDVQRDDLGSSAPLHFEREETVPASNIEAARTFKIRPGEVSDDLAMVVPPSRCDPTWQVNRVVPGETINFVMLDHRIHHGSCSTTAAASVGETFAYTAVVAGLRCPQQVLGQTHIVAYRQTCVANPCLAW